MQVHFGVGWNILRRRSAASRIAEIRLVEADDGHFLQRYEPVNVVEVDVGGDRGRIDCGMRDEVLRSEETLFLCRKLNRIERFGRAPSCFNSAMMSNSAATPDALSNAPL
jgi:hypothetical protein